MKGLVSGIACTLAAIGLVWVFVPRSPSGVGLSGSPEASLDSPALPALPVLVSSAPRDPPTIQLTPADETSEGFPRSITIRDGQQTRQVEYTGSFLRTRKVLFVTLRLYEIASYVESPQPGESESLLDGLLEDGPAKVYVIRFTMKLSGQQITSTIRKEIDETFTDVDMDRLADGIDRFVDQFSRGSSPGNVVYLAWLPGGRVYNGYETTILDRIATDFPFARAIWRIWAGEQAGPERFGLVRLLANDTQAGPN